MPEIDYLLGQRYGNAARRAFLSDLAAGRFSVACLERGDYARVVELEARLPRPIIVAISGFGGSGKSTLAEKLREKLGDAEIVSLDAFIIDRCQGRSADWEAFDRERFRTQVLVPVTRGETAKYEEYDWASNTTPGWRTVPKTRCLIVEGCSLLHPDLLKYYDFTVWVDCPLELATQRGIERDRRGEVDHEAYWLEVWQPNEQDFFNKYRPDEVARFIYHSHPE